jgi:hypothetical protein
MLSSAAVVDGSGQSLPAERRGVTIESAVRATSATFSRLTSAEAPSQTVKARGARRQCSSSLAGVLPGHGTDVVTDRSPECLNRRIEDVHMRHAVLRSVRLGLAMVVLITPWATPVAMPNSPTAPVLRLCVLDWGTRTIRVRANTQQSPVFGRQGNCCDRSIRVPVNRARLFHGFSARPTGSFLGYGE